MSSDVSFTSLPVLVLQYQGEHTSCSVIIRHIQFVGSVREFIQHKRSFWAYRVLISGKWIYFWREKEEDAKNDRGSLLSFVVKYEELQFLARGGKPPVPFENGVPD